MYPLNLDQYTKFQVHRVDLELRVASGETQKILKILSVIPQTITNPCTEVIQNS